MLNSNVCVCSLRCQQVSGEVPSPVIVASAEREINSGKFSKAGVVVEESKAEKREAANMIAEARIEELQNQLLEWKQKHEYLSDEMTLLRGRHELLQQLLRTTTTGDSSHTYDSSMQSTLEIMGPPRENIGAVDMVLHNLASGKEEATNFNMNPAYMAPARTPPRRESDFVL